MLRVPGGTKATKDITHHSSAHVAGHTSYRVNCKIIISLTMKRKRSTSVFFFIENLDWCFINTARLNDYWPNKGLFKVYKCEVSDHALQPLYVNKSLRFLTKNMLSFKLKLDILEDLYCYIQHKSIHIWGTSWNIIFCIEHFVFRSPRWPVIIHL